MTTPPLPPDRLPTPAELGSALTALGWGVVELPGRSPALRVPDPGDPLVPLVRALLAREPYRSAVRVPPPKPAPTPATPPEPAWDQTSALRAMEAADAAVESSGVSGSEVMDEARAVAGAYYRRDGAGFRAALAALSRATESRRASPSAACSGSSTTGSPGSG